MSEHQALRLAAMLTEKQKRELLLLVRVMSEAVQAKAVVA